MQPLTRIESLPSEPDVTPQKILIQCRRGPYSTSLARTGIELAMAAAVFDQEVSLLFSGDGIWQLVADQSSELIAEKNHSRLISALPLYDVHTIYVDRESLSARSLSVNDLCLPVAVVDKRQLPQLLAASDQVFNF